MLCWLLKYDLFSYNWKCNTFGASPYDGNHWNPYPWGFFDGIWINKHDIWLCFEFLFPEMLGPLQC